MKRFAHLAGSILAVALLLAPAVWACCDAGSMDSPCAMHAGPEASPSAMGAMAEMDANAGHASMHRMPCHGGERFSGGCCETTSTVAPVLAQTKEAAHHSIALEAADRDPIVTPASVASAIRQGAPGASGLHDLGRYTLFSALLL